MEKLLLLLGQARYIDADDQGDEEINLNFDFPNQEGIEGMVVTVQVDALKGLELKNPDGSPVDFSSIYEDYDRDSEGNEKTEEESEDDKE